MKNLAAEILSGFYGSAISKFIAPGLNLFLNILFNCSTRLPITIHSWTFQFDLIFSEFSPNTKIEFSK
jgi:hypothetical protein